MMGTPAVSFNVIEYGADGPLNVGGLLVAQASFEENQFVRLKSDTSG